MTGVATVSSLDEEFSLLSSVVLLKPKREALDSYYLKYFLNSSGGLRMITGEMTGSAIKRIILRKVRAAYISLPPLPAQKKIANILFVLDKKIQAEQTKKKALEELFKTLLHNLMTGKIRVNHLEGFND
jgi:type I restriction enzyme S subunit